MSLFEPRIVRATPQDEENLIRSAKADNHVALQSTHLVIKSNEIVGALSIGAIPMVLVWMHTKKTSVRDTLAVMNFVENSVSQNSRLMVLPCADTSPFHPYLKDMRSGYLNAGEYTHFIKKL